MKSSNFSQIKELLNAYFDMLYFCDLDLFDRVFHPAALYATADEKPALIRNMQEYRPIIEKRESPSDRSEARHDVIDNIRLAGDNTAFAEVRCSIGQRDFVDFLTIIRTNNEWKIISKIFHISKKEAA